MAKKPIGHVGSDSGPSVGDDGTVSESGIAGVAIDTSTAADVEPPKRKGGWPAGKPRTGSSGNSRSGGNTGTGTSARAQKEKAQLDLSGIAGALAGIHLGIAMITKMDHWQIGDDEAEAMAKSVANVARHYPKVASSQKLIDWTMLIGSLGMVYVPRALETQRVMKERNLRNAADN